MKQSAFIAAALVFILTGCVSARLGPEENVRIGKVTIAIAGLDGFNPAVRTPPDPHQPNVFITAEKLIVVDQEPIRPTRVVQGRVGLIWALDVSTTFIFPDDDAIKLMAGTGNPLPDNLDCGVAGTKKKVFACVYDKPSMPRQWKYKIRVKDTATNTELTALDPWVHQP
jgi:hypothetical protein